MDVLDGLLGAGGMLWAAAVQSDLLSGHASPRPRSPRTEPAPVSDGVGRRDGNEQSAGDGSGGGSGLGVGGVGGTGGRRGDGSDAAKAAAAATDEGASSLISGRADDGTAGDGQAGDRDGGSGNQGGGTAKPKKAAASAPSRRLINQPPRRQRRRTPRRNDWACARLPTLVKSRRGCECDCVLRVCVR